MSSNNNNNNPSSMWQHQQSDNLNNSVNQRMEGSLPTLFQTSSNLYPSNSEQNRQMLQESPGCRSTNNFMARNQEKFNVLQHTDQTEMMQRSLGMLQMPAFNQSLQNVTLMDQMKLGNQAQTMRLGLLQESTPQPDWMDQAYDKISQMKEKFSPEVLTLYKRAQEAKQSANNAETMNRCEKIRISAERAINFLCMSRSDISCWRKEKLNQTMNEVVKYVQQARASNSLAVQRQNQRVESNYNGDVSLENIIQFNSRQPSFNQSSSCQINPIMRSTVQTGFDQRALKMFLNPTQLNINKNIFGQSDHHSVSPTLQNKQQNDQAVKRQKNKQQNDQAVKRQKNKQQQIVQIKRWSPLSAGAISPQKSQQSGSHIELKDLSSPSSSKFSKSAAVSVSASSSAFPSPLTPLTPCSKPADFAKSPVSIDESCKFPQNFADPPLQYTSKNLNVADAQAVVMKSGTNTEPTEKQSSRDEEDDPVKRLVDAVTSMSPRALNSAIQDIDAVTSLTDTIATNFLQGDSTQVIFQDLADDISKFIMQSTTKDQMETTTTLNQTKTEMQFCVSGSGERLKKEPSSDQLFQEIKEINQRFMEVKVDVMNIDDVSRIGFYEDIVVRCSYVPVGPASQQMIDHKLFLELIVPADYPRISPTVSEKMPPGCGDPDQEGKNLWTKAKSNFSLRLRTFCQPITVKQMARAWETSAREVFLEYAEQMGGGSLFSSKFYGKWDIL